MVVVSLVYPKVMLASDLRVLSLGVHLFFMFVMWFLYIIDVSYVTLSILGVWYGGVVYGLVVQLSS